MEREGLGVKAGGGGGAEIERGTGSEGGGGGGAEIERGTGSEGGGSGWGGGNKERESGKERGR